MSARDRQFPRYDLAHSLDFGGTISECPVRLRLATLSAGGCGFVGGVPQDEFFPPKEVVCSIFSSDGSKAFAESRLLIGNLIYIRPTNIFSGDSYFYGVRFHVEDRYKVQDFIADIEKRIVTRTPF